MRAATTIACLAVVGLAACASAPPPGPSVMVLPGSGKTFEHFRADETECRRYARAQAGTDPDQAYAESALKSAAVGTAVGAAAGALIGGRNGAAVGAGTGLIAGSAAGAGAAGVSARALQQRYDIAYQQCMYAKGHRVPLAARYENPRRAGRAAPPPPPEAPAP